jgi:DNA polymerase-3 subunit delta'
MNRPRIIALGDSCTGRGKEEHYAMVIRLTMLALSRMALTAARGEPSPIDGESDLNRFASNSYHAQLWADLVQAQSARIAHARAVNLDPGQVILDTFLAIDSTAGRASLLSA